MRESPAAMQTPPIFCPECGAPVPLRAAAALTVVCEYCGSTLVRTGADAQLLGKVSAIVDNGSPLLLGGRGIADDGRAFELVGRLQLKHQRGTWNEWYVLFGEGDGWLAEAQGSLYLVRRAPLRDPGVLRWGALNLGQELRLAGTSYSVVELRRAEYLGAEGCLPFVATPGRAYLSADLLSAEGRFATLDYGDDQPQPDLYVGAAVTLMELGIRPLRRFEGWEAADG